MLLDIRIYEIEPGRREEFETLASDETIPLAKSLGHRVVAFGRSTLDDDRYVLIRSFADHDDREARLHALYGSEVWAGRYEDRVDDIVRDFTIATLEIEDREPLGID